MDDSLVKGKSTRGVVRFFSFAAVGSTLLIDQMNLLSPVRIGMGIVIGLIFGWLYRQFLKALLSLFNGKVRKEKGRRAVAFAIENGMLFLTPFAIMALIAAFYLRWPSTMPFLATGVMAVGTASAFEMARFLEKPGFKNTVITSLIAFLFSFVLTLGAPYLLLAANLAEGAVKLIPTLMGQGGGM